MRRCSICSESDENNVLKIWSCDGGLESVQQRISDRLHIYSQAKVAEGFCWVRPTFWRTICYFGISHYFNWTSSTLENWSHWDQSIVNLWWSHILYSAVLFCCYGVTLVLYWSRDAVSGLQRYIKHTYNKISPFSLSVCENTSAFIIHLGPSIFPYALLFLNGLHYS